MATDAVDQLEAAALRDRALALLSIGDGDHTPTEVQEQVAAIARRLAALEPPIGVERPPERPALGTEDGLRSLRLLGEDEEVEA